LGPLSTSSQTSWVLRLSGPPLSTSKVTRLRASSRASAVRHVRSAYSDFANWATEDGFYAEEDRPGVADGPKQKQKVLKKIPEHVRLFTLSQIV
jgi:hypothetical protein